ncbi:MAG: protein-glutamate methylesterase/protein-glutamine glutaminase [Fibrobacterota bacterium]
MKRVLIVDDSLVYRKIIAGIIDKIDGVRTAGQARDGIDALEKTEKLSPDIITLDIEMPRMDGIETLRRLRKTHPDIPVIMLSSTTKFGRDATITALNEGAFSFIAKPDTDSFDSADILYSQLSTAIKETILTEFISHGETPSRHAQPRRDFAKPEIIAIGCSTGGPKALSGIIPALPAHIGVPLVIVQHMPAGFTQALAQSLNAKSALQVTEAAEGEVLRKNHVYIAPGGKHIKIRRGRIQVTEDPPEKHCRPSVNYLFRSLAREYGEHILALILTGMGNDGTDGLKEIKQSPRAKVIGEDKSTCVVYGMPKEAHKAGYVDIQLPAYAIAGEIEDSL